MAVQKIKLKIGTVYQKEPNGVYYFRYQVNGARKAISLKTRNKQQAIKEAEKYVPLIQATSSEVIAAHVKYARNLASPENALRYKLLRSTVQLGLPNQSHPAVPVCRTVWSVPRRPMPETSGKRLVPDFGFAL